MGLDSVETATARLPFRRLVLMPWRWRWWVWLALLPAGYVASIGPAAALYQAGYFPGPMKPYIRLAYAPLVRLFDEWPAIRPFFESLIEFWKGCL